MAARLIVGIGCIIGGLFALVSGFIVPSLTGSTARGCGPASLRLAAKRLGLSLSPEQVNRLFNNPDADVSFSEIDAAARTLGFGGRAESMTAQKLRTDSPTGILHVDGCHFVAVIGYESTGPYIAEPISTSAVYESVWPWTTLDERWDGKILVISRVGKNDR